MGTAVFWEKLKPALRAAEIEQAERFSMWLTSLKKGIAEVATTKSLQRFGREEEKE